MPALLAVDQKNEYLLIRVPGDGMTFPSEIKTIRPPLPNPVAQLAWVQFILPRLLEREQIDIYHSLKHLGPFRLKAKKVYTQGAVGHFHGNYPLRWYETLYWKILGRMFLRSVDHVIAVSQFVADGIPKDLGIKQSQIRVIPHGLDPIYITANAMSNPVGSKPMHILAVGNLLPVKNFSTLIRAYARLDSDLRQRFPLVIAGSTANAEFSRLRALSEREGVSNSVRFEGEVQKDALIHLLEGRSFLSCPLCTSRSGSHYSRRWPRAYAVFVRPAAAPKRLVETVCWSFKILQNGRKSKSSGSQPHRQ